MRHRREWKLRQATVACGLAVLAFACLPLDPSVAGALERGVAQWEARGPASYQLILQRGPCECLPEWLIPVRVDVRDNAIYSVTNADTGEPVPVAPFHAMTVDDLFDLVRAAIDQNADRVEVRYDRRWGYPRSIFIDYSLQGADDELSITTGDLVPSSS
jgi:hypothetical protein